MRETIEGVRRLLSGQTLATEGGRFLRGSAEAYLRFRPPRVTPIYVGAMGPALLALAGELADGALPLLLPPEHYATVRPLIEAGLARRTTRGGRSTWRRACGSRWPRTGRRRGAPSPRRSPTTARRSAT